MPQLHGVPICLQLANGLRPTVSIDLRGKTTIVRLPVTSELASRIAHTVGHIGHLWMIKRKAARYLLDHQAETLDILQAKLQKSTDVPFDYFLT